VVIPQTRFVAPFVARARQKAKIYNNILIDKETKKQKVRIAFIRARAPHSLRLYGMPAGQTPLR
jgi:hypothetical protein